MRKATRPRIQATAHWLLTVGVLTCALLVSADALTYPSSVQYPAYDGGPVEKIYEVRSEEEIAQLPTAEFVLGAYTYTHQDTICTERSDVEEKEYAQSIEISADTQDREKLRTLLGETMEVSTEDGYTGTLTLDLDSISAQASAYGTSSNTKTLTRQYPNLSDADLSYVPKTVESGGRTYTLSNVSWAQGTVYNPYDEEAGLRFTATATYSSTISSKYAKAYTVTARYTGTISKVTQSKIQCVLVFYPSATATAAPKSAALPFDPWQVLGFVLLICLILFLLACVAYTAAGLLRPAIAEKPKKPAGRSAPAQTKPAAPGKQRRVKSRPAPQKTVRTIPAPAPKPRPVPVPVITPAPKTLTVEDLEETPEEEDLEEIQEEEDLEETPEEEDLEEIPEVEDLEEIPEVEDFKEEDLDAEDLEEAAPEEEDFNFSYEEEEDNEKAPFDDGGGIDDVFFDGPDFRA